MLSHYKSCTDAISTTRVMSPLCPLFTVTPVTLLILLLLNGGNVRSCGRDQPHPKITPFEWDPHTIRRSPEYRSVILGNPILTGSYRNNIRVFCSSSDASNLTIQDARDPDDMKDVQAVRFNSTTIQVLLDKPDVGYYAYCCTDSNTHCTDALYIQVHPAMSATAPRIHHTLNKYGYTLYFVALGESYDVFCSAQQITDLNMEWDQQLETKPYNETTLIATVSDHTDGERKYICGNFDYPSAEISIMVDKYPEASEFCCMLYDKSVQCSWKSSSKENTFKLFVLLMYDHTRRLICIDRSGALTAGCVGELDNESTSLLSNYEDLSLQLETCNSVFCSNQTFQINIRSSTKLQPVYGLKLTNAGPLSVTVAWQQNVVEFYSAYKIEYRLLGTDWRPVNASAVQCKYSDVCGISLALPCPDTHYDLRVFLRYKVATNDKYWSEPASIYFFTAPSTGEVDPACGADFREVTEKPPLTANLVLYKVRELISDERKETKELKAKIVALKKKLATVKALMSSRSESDAGGSGRAP